MQPMPPMQPPYPQQPPPPSWLKKNWMWLVGGGCLTLFLCCGGFAAVTYFAASSAVKSSGAYLQAVKEIQTSEAAENVLGRPIEMGFLSNSSLNENNGQGTMEFSVKVSGPKGKGVVTGRAHKGGGEWVQDHLELTLDNGQRVDLLMKQGGAVVPPPPAHEDAPPADLPADSPPADQPPSDPVQDLQPDEVKVDDKLNEPLIPEDQRKP